MYNGKPRGFYFVKSNIKILSQNELEVESLESDDQRGAFGS